MNNKRRDLLKTALALLARASEIVSFALDEEQDCLDNMPENLQGSERYETMEAAIDYLEDVESFIEEAKSGIENAIA